MCGSSARIVGASALYVLEKVDRGIAAIPDSILLDPAHDSLPKTIGIDIGIAIAVSVAIVLTRVQKPIAIAKTEEQGVGSRKLVAMLRSIENPKLDFHSIFMVLSLLLGADDCADHNTIYRDLLYGGGILPDWRTGLSPSPSHASARSKTYKDWPQRRAIPILESILILGIQAESV
jgi:hypothetical protein